MTRQEINNLNYKELYDKFTIDFQNQRVFHKIHAAYEVDCSFSGRGLKLTEEEFETVCSYVYEWFLCADNLAMEELTENIADRIANKDFTIQDLEDDDPRAQELIEINF